MARNQVATGKIKRTLVTPFSDLAVFLAPVTGQITRVHVEVSSAPVGGTALFDVHINGTTIWPTQSNRVTIPDGGTEHERTGLTAAITKDDVVTLDFDGFTGSADSIGTYILLTIEMEETGATASDSELRARASHTGTQLASTISDFSSTVAGLVQPAIDSVSDDLDDHIADTADAHDASAISIAPFGSIAATTVQAALEEIVAEASGYSDEQAQDAVGTILDDSGDIDFTYDDGTPKITAIVKANTITEAKIVLADNTTNNASTSNHGFLKKLSNVSTEFMDGTGGWSTPSASGPGNYGARLVKTATQSISNNSSTEVTFDSETQDDLGFHSNVTNNSRLTIPAGMGGWYYIEANAYWAANATGERIAQIKKNGSILLQSAVDNACDNGGLETINMIGTLAYLAAGDYVELFVYQNSGGSLNLTIATNEGTYFALAALGNLSGGTNPGNYAAKITKSGTQSASNNATTVVTFDTEERDDLAFHDTVTNNSRITIPAAMDGWYLIVGNLLWNVHATGSRTAELLKNGATALAATRRASNATTVFPTLQVSALVYLVAGDYVEMQGFQDSGGSLNIMSSATGEGTWLSIVSLGNLVGAVSIKTTAYSVLSSDVGKKFTNEGASASVAFTLPTAVANLEYTFYVQDGDGLSVIAAAGDTIRIETLVTAAAGNVSSSTIGSSVTLKAINATEWVAISAIGSWS